MNPSHIDSVVGAIDAEFTNFTRYATPQHRSLIEGAFQDYLARSSSRAHAEENAAAPSLQEIFAPLGEEQGPSATPSKDEKAEFDRLLSESKGHLLQ